MRRNRDGRRALNRREFLKIGGASFAGAVMFGATACGGGGRAARPNLYSLSGQTLQQRLQDVVEQGS
ncbi:MAG: hypothetical protein ACRDSJ_04065 [Rubrobacteraceae bacterium]